MEFLEQNFNFQSLIKREAMLLPSMWLKDWQIKIKTSKIVTKMGKHFILLCSNIVLLAHLAFNFHSAISINTTFCF